jgi:hypothetical protein
MSPSKALVLLVALLATILSHNAEAQTGAPRQQRSKATPFKFPASVGSFRRVEIINYTPDGLNRSASYTSPSGLMTAYVYPAGPPFSASLPSHFEECRREIRQLWGRTRSVSRRAVSINRNGRVYPGMEEVFSGKFPRSKSEAVSRLLVFQAGDRYVKFRFTSPKEVSAQAPSQLAAFIQRFPWPVEPPARATRL